MAYNNANLSLVSQSLKGDMKTFMYLTADAPSVVEGAGYFSDGYTQGMLLGNVVVVVNSATGQVSETSVTTAGTAAAPATTVSSPLEDSDFQVEFGQSGVGFNMEGNLNRQISSAGVEPGALAADNVLMVYSLPPNSLDIAGRGITITASGSFGATGNNKRVKIIVNPATAVVGSTVGSGGTTICDTGTVATNGTGWQLQGSVFKYGAGGSNTQIGLHDQAQIGAAVASMLAPSLITATESAAILVAITGNAATAVSDILANFLEVNAMN